MGNDAGWAFQIEFKDRSLEGDSLLSSIGKSISI